jgi:hypothetical protein
MTLAYIVLNYYIVSLYAFFIHLDPSHGANKIEKHLKGITRQMVTLFDCNLLEEMTPYVTENKDPDRVIIEQFDHLWPKSIDQFIPIIFNRKWKSQTAQKMSLELLHMQIATNRDLQLKGGNKTSINKTINKFWHGQDMRLNRKWLSSYLLKYELDTGDSKKNYIDSAFIDACWIGPIKNCQFVFEKHDNALRKMALSYAKSRPECTNDNIEFHFMIGTLFDSLLIHISSLMISFAMDKRLALGLETLYQSKRTGTKIVDYLVNVCNDKTRIKDEMYQIYLNWFEFIRTMTPQITVV